MPVLVIADSLASRYHQDHVFVCSQRSINGGLSDEGKLSTVRRDFSFIV